jgi:hypothetical protein
MKPLAILVCLGAAFRSPASAQSWLRPFAPTSIWNMPVGAGAIYVPSGIQPSYFLETDDEILVVTAATDPAQPVFAPGAWGPGRCTGAEPLGTVIVPDALIVPDAVNTNTPNNASAFLMPDGRTLVQLEPLARCAPGGTVYGWMWPNVDLMGDGILGSHGGSSLSAIGGSIRIGELLGDAPIPHALKIELWAHLYYFYSAQRPGFRWPASTADSGAGTFYGGTNPQLMMGSLLAIPPGITAQSLSITTPVGMKIFTALQTYGAYVVDDTAWNATALCAETGVDQQVLTSLGYNMNASSGPLYDDMMRILPVLAVVANNSPRDIGGGPRATTVNCERRFSESTPEQQQKLCPAGH